MQTNGILQFSGLCHAGYGTDCVCTLPLFFLACSGQPPQPAHRKLQAPGLAVLGGAPNVHKPCAVSRGMVSFTLRVS